VLLQKVSHDWLAVRSLIVEINNHYQCLLVRMNVARYLLYFRPNLSSQENSLWKEK